MNNSDKTETITIDLHSLIEPASRILAALVLGICLIISANIVVGGGGIQVSSSSSTTSESVDGATTIDTGSPMTTSISDNPIQGDKSKATVAIVQFSDFECPFCKSYYQTTGATIKSNYIDTGKVIMVYRYLPLSFHEPAASLEAEAGACVDSMAGDTAFYKMHDKMFDTTQSNGAGLTMDQLSAMVTSIGGINVNDFKTCVTTAKFQDKITADTNAASALGINGTPGFVVGKLSSDGTVTGEYISGAQAYSVFQTAIEKYL